nr:histone deacetylase 14 [Tanacetum cinerariifolium]
MADVNVNALADQAPTMAPPTHTDDQILPHIRSVPIGKSNCYLDVKQSQSNPIYKITTFGCYKCQLDEQWFDLTKDTLRDALQITLVNNNKSFSSPPSSDALINFINDLGYPKAVKNLSNARKHKFYPRRDSPLHLPNEEPVLGYLKFSAKGTKREVFRMPIPGNLITSNIQGEPYYQEYLEKVAKHQRYLAGEQGSDPDSPANYSLRFGDGILGVAFCLTGFCLKEVNSVKVGSKCHYLGNTMTNVTAPTGQAPTMATPVRSNDQCLARIRWVQTGYLKFSAKGAKREVFGMHVPGSLINADLREVSYYQEYLENVVKHRWFLSGEPVRKPNQTAQKVRIHILQYLIHLRMCKDVPTKMMKMFLLVENLRRQNPDNREVLHPGQILFKICATSVRKYG